MPAPHWFEEYGSPFNSDPINPELSKERTIPGSVAIHINHKNVQLTRFDWESGIYHLGLCQLESIRTKWIEAREYQPGVRFEAVLKGEMHIIDQAGETTKLKEGQYHFTTGTPYRVRLTKNGSCDYFICYYPPELIFNFGSPEISTTNHVRYLPDVLSDIIKEALRNPYQGTLQDFYYRKLVADILFFHLTGRDETLSPELTVSDIDAVRKADAILSADLSMHYKIPDLSALAGTNEYKLKRGFRLVFKMGIFARLLNKRMDHAKFLLTSTRKPIKEIAYEAGYETHAGFITSFRKRFGKTPLEWRQEGR